MIRFRLSLRYIYIVASIFACGVSGCTRRIPVATVVLVDPSGSVTLRARQDELVAVAALIPKMQRGDSLTIIPITDNATADIQGRVLRLHAPMRRSTYDADLRQFRSEAAQQYSSFAANLLMHPGQRTDILGALDVARQEIAPISEAELRRLIILSDFLEDDGTYRFVSNWAMREPDSARRLAACLQKAHAFTAHGVRIDLGGLESSESAHLDAQRRKAVRAFWSAYFQASGEQSEIQLDGTALLAPRREHLGSPWGDIPPSGKHLN
jgi:hypothetical protein